MKASRESLPVTINGTNRRQFNVLSLSDVAKIDQPPFTEMLYLSCMRRASYVDARQMQTGTARDSGRRG